MKSKETNEFVAARERVKFVERFSARVQCLRCGAVRYALVPLPKGSDLPIGPCRVCGSWQEKVTMQLAALAAIIQKARR